MKYYIQITPFFPSEDSFRGGYIYDQVKAIERNSDYKVLVFTPKYPWEKAEDYEFGGIKVIRFNAFVMPSLVLNGLSDKINGRLFLRKIKSLGIDIKDIEVVHGHTAHYAVYALDLKKLNPNIKTIVQHHDCDPYQIRNGKWADKRWNAGYKAKSSISLFEKVDLHICISNYVREMLTTFPHINDNIYYQSYRDALSLVKNMSTPKIKDTYVLYNGVDTTKFYPDVKEWRKTTNNGFTIGCIGNFVELKDHMTLLKAVEQLVLKGQENLKVILVGSGSLHSELEDYISSHKLTHVVEIHPEVNHERLRDLYCSFDLFVLPSIFEGFGCVCTEAAACGVPFMICRDQGASEYINPDEMDQWTFPPHDVETLTRLIDKYIKHHSQQSLVHPFDIDTLIKKFLNVLETN